MPRRTRTPAPPPPWRPDAGNPLRAIRRFARQVAELFDPERIILFGSLAYGTPNPDSDVDILVIMPARNTHDQAVKIRLAFDVPFPMDLLVRTPYDMARRLKDGDSFHTEIMSRGKVLYEKSHGGMGAESRGRSRSRQSARRRKSASA